MEIREEIAKRDTRTTQELVKAILSTKDEDDAWALVQVLHARGTQTELNVAQSLCKSKTSIERELGADILGQLGAADYTYMKQSVEALLLLLSDQSYDVISASIVALAHRGDEIAVNHIVKLKNHPDDSIRESVAYALGVIGGESPNAIESLIQLSRDKNNDVRNWATFGIGTQLEKDSTEIRQALANRLNDEDSEIRGEAIVGLVKRKYPNIDRYILKEFHCDFVSLLSLEAAELSGDSILYPELKKLQSDYRDLDDEYFLDQLNKAITACQPKPERI